MKNSKYQVNFDNNWKGMVSEMAEDFLAFFLPDLYHNIDLSQPILCIEEELYNQIQEADKERIVEKLVCVQLKNGQRRSRNLKSKSRSSRSKSGGRSKDRAKMSCHN